jgi:hypothetical protein
MGNFTDPEMVAWLKKESKKKTGESKKSLQKRYYNTVYKDKINQAVGQAMEANPDLMFDGTKLVNQRTGKSYPIDDPNKVKPGKSREDQFSALRNLKNIANAASNKDWERRPKDIKAKAKHGKGSGFFDKVGKDLSSAVKDTGKIIKSAGKISAGSLEGTGALLRGDFKGAGKGALKSFGGVSDIGAVAGGRTGSIFGNKKMGEMAGRIGTEMLANATTAGGFGLAKTAAQGLAGKGIGGLVSGDALKDAALGAAGSYVGVDPSMLKAGLAATKGDLKGAALQGLGSMGGLDPKTMQYASTGLSALTGDKKGFAKGIASQFGASDNIANMIGSLASNDKKGLARDLASQFGASENVANMLGSAVTGDKKGLASNLASQFGADKNIARMIGSAAGGDKSGLASGLASEFGAGEEVSGIAGKFASGKTAEEIATEKALRAGGSMANRKIPMGGLGFDRSEVEQKIKKDFKALKRVPGGIPSDVYGKFRDNTTDKFLKDASGKTIMGADNAPIPNPRFSSKDYDKRQAQLSEWGEDAATYIPGQKLGEEIGEEKWSMSRVLGNLKREGGKALDQVKSGASSARDFAAENKTALGLAAQGAAAYGGYRAGEKGRDAATGIQRDQLSQVQGAGREFEGIDYDPNRYNLEQEFRKNRIAGGGVTAQERQMQSEGDIRAARMAAAQRMGGIETQARLGGAGLGTAALAGALGGSQAEQNIQQQTNLARETSASDRLERDIERTGALSTQQTMEEANLAQAQGQFGLNKAAQAGITRANLGDLEMARANALQNLYGRGADLATAGLNTMKSREDLQREEQERAYQKQQQDLENRKKEAEINALNRQGSVPAAGTTTPTIQKQTTPPPAQKPPVQKPPVQNVNANAQTPTTNKLNQTYSGPMARPVNTAMDTAAKAKEEADKFKKDPFGTIGSWGNK